MHVIIADHTGFCDGVKRAIALAQDAAVRHGGVHADGPLLHNRQAMELLRLHGVTVFTGDEPPADNLPLLIRAHGIPPGRREKWHSRDGTVIDATCVHVARNQRLATKADKARSTLLFAGDRDHAETRAVVGCAGPSCRIIATPEEAELVQADGPVTLMAQTTFDTNLFDRIAAVVQERFPDASIHDTICRATHVRQEEAARLAGLADVLVVVGGSHSANTRRLTEIGQTAGKPVLQVETADELQPASFAGFRRAAVISGASTPGWITQDVVNRLHTIGGTPISNFMHRLVQFLIQTRLSTAVSGFFLALAASWLVLVEPDLRLAAAGGCYLFFAHTINRRVPRHPEARRISAADRYFESRRLPLALGAAVALAASIAIVFRATPMVMAVYSLAIVAALFNAIWTAWRPHHGVRPFPRNWIMALGWAAVLGSPLFTSWLAGGLVALYIFPISLAGSIIRDIQDTVSDRLMGIDTIPGRLGVKAATTLCRAALRLAAALPLCLAAMTVTETGYWWNALLAAAPLWGLYVLKKVTRRDWRDAVAIQMAADGMGVIAGMSALAGVWIR